jgi:hypothetical protein
MIAVADKVEKFCLRWKRPFTVKVRKHLLAVTAIGFGRFVEAMESRPCD